MLGLKFRDTLPSVVRDELESLTAALSGFLQKEHNEDGTHVTRPRGFDFVPTGAMQMWPTDTPPEGWLLCNGDAISRVTYTGLFQLIGTAYGAGDGVLTFNLPDLRQRFPLGKAATGTGSTLGDTGGDIDHVHAGGSHTHEIDTDGDHTHDPGTLVMGNPSATQAADITPGFQDAFASQYHHHDLTGATATDGTHDHGGETGAATGGDTGAANPPFVTVNFIILSGV